VSREPGPHRQIGTGAAASVNPPAALRTPSSNSTPPYKGEADKRGPRTSWDGLHLQCPKNAKNSCLCYDKQARCSSEAKNKSASAAPTSSSMAVLGAQPCSMFARSGSERRIKRATTHGCQTSSDELSIYSAEDQVWFMEYMPARPFTMLLTTVELEGRELFGAIQQIDDASCSLIIYQKALLISSSFIKMAEEPDSSSIRMIRHAASKKVRHRI
jgi:hypothetical protein